MLKHRKIAKIYSTELADCTAVKVLPYDPDCSYWLYSLLVKEGTKEEFIEYLKDQGIAASPVHHRNDNYACTAAFKGGDLPGVDAFYREQVSIPVGWWLKSRDVAYIIETIRRYKA